MSTSEPTENNSGEPKYRDEQWLREQYIELDRTAKDIADECDTAPCVISEWSNRHDLPSKNAPADERLADEEWLRKQYVTVGFSTLDIAGFCDCSVTAVKNWLDRHGIETREYRGHRPATYEKLQDEEWLRQQYIDDERSTYDIAESVGCEHSQVRRKLNEYGIETRDVAGENNPSWAGGVFPYGPGWNKDKRQRVRGRDGHTCRDPNCSVTQEEHLKRVGSKLHVHHLRRARDVDDPEERNAMENLVTLCSSCHRRWEKMSAVGLVPQVEGV